MCSRIDSKTSNSIPSSIQVLSRFLRYHKKMFYQEKIFKAEILHKYKAIIINSIFSCCRVRGSMNGEADIIVVAVDDS